MADKSISELTAATAVGSSDLFVLEQTGTAKKLTGQILENWLVSFADGHGGIQSIAKTGSAGTDPVIDTYTITLADETTFTFTVTNGLKGDTGAQTYVWIKWSADEPTQDSDMGDVPDAWIGIYVGLSSTAPTTYTSYTWYEYKGDKGDQGDPAELTSASVSYQLSTSGTVVPTGTWTTLVPTPEQGKYLWTRVVLSWNNESPITFYSVSHYGSDGEGAVASVNGVAPIDGDVTVTANDILVEADNVTVEAEIAKLKTAILHFTSQAVSQATNAQIMRIPASGTNSNITEDSIVLKCEWADPTKITSNVAWTSYDGYIVFTGTTTGSTTADVIVGRKGN